MERQYRSKVQLSVWGVEKEVLMYGEGALYLRFSFIQHWEPSIAVWYDFPSRGSVNVVLQVKVALDGSTVIEMGVEVLAQPKLFCEW